jgi:hypothetical protein
MKKLYTAIFAIILAIVSDNGALAQISVTGQIFAEVIDAITATETSQLNFGSFSPGILGGKIIMSPEGVALTTGTVIMGSGVPNPGSFYLTGDDAASFSISLPDGPAILTHLSSSKEMTVSDWISDPPAGEGTGMFQGGSQTVNIGATLNISNLMENPPGLYSGTYVITFDYN